MRAPASVLCASGLAAEARIARAAGFRAVVGGGDPQRTAALVAAAARETRCFVSFGVAGGLAPHVVPGEVILSTSVVADGRVWRPNPRFAAEIAALAASIGATDGAVFGAPAILATAAAKRHAWEDTGAVAADLESAIVARAAAVAGVPFLVLRTIADPACRALPPAALIPLASDGTPALSRVTAEVLRRPRQIAALFGLARETRQALAALAGAAHALRVAVVEAA